VVHNPDSDRILSVDRILSDPILFVVGFIHLGRSPICRICHTTRISIVFPSHSRLIRQPCTTKCFSKNSTAITVIIDCNYRWNRFGFSSSGGGGGYHKSINWYDKILSRRVPHIHTKAYYICSEWDFDYWNRLPEILNMFIWEKNNEKKDKSNSRTIHQSWVVCKSRLGTVPSLVTISFSSFFCFSSSQKVSTLSNQLVCHPLELLRNNSSCG
jgi:hypothetical protein